MWFKRKAIRVSRGCQRTQLPAWPGWRKTVDTNMASCGIRKWPVALIAALFTQVMHRRLEHPCQLKEKAALNSCFLLAYKREALSSSWSASDSRRMSLCFRNTQLLAHRRSAILTIVNESMNKKMRKDKQGQKREYKKERRRKRNREKERERGRIERKRRGIKGREETERE